MKGCLKANGDTLREHNVLSFFLDNTEKKVVDLSRNKVACENIRFSSLFAAGGVSCGGTSVTQRQKFHTDDVKSVRNPVRSADWSTQQLHCLRYCL